MQNILILSIFNPKMDLPIHIWYLQYLCFKLLLFNIILDILELDNKHILYYQLISLTSSVFTGGYGDKSP